MLVVSAVPPHEWISSEAEARKLLDACMGAEIVCIDTETDTLNKTKATVVIWSLAIKGRRAALPRSVLEIFKPFFLSNVPKTMHNAPYDRHVVENTCGVRMQGPIYDTKPMAVMSNTEMSNYRLKFLASDGLFDPYDPRYIKYEEIFRGKLKTTTEAIKVLGLPAVANYASLDAHSGLTVFEELRNQLRNTESIYDNTLWDIYESEEVLFSDVLYDCERNGFLIDVEYLKEKAEIAQAKINELSEEFVSRARTPINLKSPKQLSEFFYGTLGRAVKKRTKGGKTGKTSPSVDETVLNTWAKEGDPYARILLEYRAHTKIKSTYIDGLVEAADKGGRIHTTLNQAGARTGRLSSEKPNLQNIPRPGDEGDIYLLRSAFLAPEGKVLIDADYDQLEMRIMAELAGEASMIEMINKGWDVHTANASLVFGVEYEDVISAVKEKKAIEKDKSGKSGPIPERVATLCGYRQKIKNVGFGLNYGQGPTALSSSLDCSVDEAKDMIARYFERFPKVQKYIKEMHEVVETKGLIFTISGRIRYISSGFSNDHAKISEAHRAAVNSTIQGSAADIVRLAMIYCYNNKRLRELGAKMLLQVHDELIFECPEDNAEEAGAVIKEMMELPYRDEFRVRITATPEIGKKWTDVH